MGSNSNLIYRGSASSAAVCIANGSRTLVGVDHQYMTS